MRQARAMVRGAVRGAVLAASCAAAAATLAAGAAHAQLSPNKGPLDITGDSMEVHDPQHLIIWKGRVEALQDQDRLRSDLMNIYYRSEPSGPKTPGAPKAAGAPGQFSSVDRMEAIGNVYFVTPTQIAKGDKAVYTAADDTIVVTGDVVLTQGENVGRGSRLVINLATGNSTLEGGGAGPTGRPRVIVYPKQTQTPQGTSR